MFGIQIDMKYKQPDISHPVQVETKSERERERGGRERERAK